MRKILSFFIAIVFASSMMAEVGSLYYTFLPYKPSSGAVSDYTKTGTMTIDEMDWTVPGNWYATGGLRLGGKSLDGVDRVITAQNPMGSAISKIRIAHAGKTADAITLNSITVTTASDADFTQDVTVKTVNDFTVAKNKKDTIDIVPATEPWAINSYYKFAFNFTNPNASNYSFIVESIMFYAYAEGGDDPQPTEQTLYLKISSDWEYPAKYAVYYFEDGKEPGWSDFMEEVEGEINTYTTTIPLGYGNVIFARFNSTKTATGTWDDKWSQTKDLTIPEGMDFFTVTSGGTGDQCDGEWSKYTPAAPAEDVTFYLINNQEWENPTAHVFVNSTSKADWPGEAMTKTADQVNGFDVYSFTFPDTYTKIIFNDGAAQNTIQTVDLEWAKANPYFVPGATNGEGKFEGTWYATLDEIPAPPTPKYHIAGAWTGWKLAELTIAADEKTATHEAELAPGEYEFKIVRTLGTDTAWFTKSNDGAYNLHREYTGVAGVTDNANNNLKVTADEGGKYVFTWTFANDSIGITFPAQHVLNETWGVGENTAVAAGTKYVDNYALTIEAVYATTLKVNARNFDGYAFTHAIQVRNAAYPSEQTPQGTEQSGSTSLVITAKEDVEVIFFYNRQTTSSETGAAALNDGKDMKVFDQAAPTTDLNAEFRVVWMQDDQKYVNAIKTMNLVKGHTYTVSAKGTTVQLSGIRYATDAEKPIELPHYYIAGSMTKWAEEMVELLPLEEKADSLGIAINLEADSLYAFKVVRVQGTDTAWYGMGGEGTMTYGNSTGWYVYKSENDQNQANVGLMTTKAAEYPFVVKVADDHMEVSVAIPVRYYAKYNVGEDWAWSMMTEKEGKWIADSVVYRGGGANVYFTEDNDHAWYFNESGEDAFKKLNAYEGLAVLDTVQFIFNPADTTLAVALLGKYPTVSVMVFMDEDYVEMPFVLSEDKASASMTANIAEGEYAFAIVVNGEGRGNDNIFFSRDMSSAEDIIGYNGDMYFEADMKGDYTFTWTFENNALAITYPDPIHYYIAGSMTDWTEHMAELTPRGGKEDSLGGSVRLLEDSLYEYKIVRVQGTDTTWYGLGEAATMEYGNSNGWWIFKSENDQNQANVGLQASTKAEYLFTVLVREDHLEVSVVIPKPFPTMKIAGEWDIEEGDWVIKPMELAADSLTASYDVDLEAGEYEFKMIKSGKWLTKANDGAFGLHREFPGVAGVVDEAENNLKLTADFAGTYVFTWTFANDSIGIEFPEIPAPHYYIAGSMTDWDLNMEELLPLEEKADSLGVTLNLDADSLYDYKIVRVQGTDTAWYGLGEAAKMEYGNSEGWWIFKSENDQNQANVGLQTTKEGEYPFILKVAEDHLEVSVAIPARYYAKYSVGEEWAWSMMTENEGLWIADSVVYRGGGANVYFKEDNENAWYFNESGEDALKAINAYEGFAALDTVQFRFNPADTTLAAILIGKYVEPTYAHADGYYLVGDFDGVAAWDIDDQKILVANTETEGEFFIENINLTVDDSLKVIYVEKDQIITWYPTDNNYVVDAAHAGVKTIYFNPIAQEAWGGHIFIAENPTPAQYGILLNGEFLPAEKNDEYTGEGEEWVVNTTMYIDDEFQIYDNANKVGWIIAIDEFGYNEFNINTEEQKYIVTANGNYALYIRLIYGADKLYVEYTAEGTDIDILDTNAPAVKIVRDGQILIIKGDKIFNIQGQQLR